MLRSLYPFRLPEVSHRQLVELYSTTRLLYFIFRIYHKLINIERCFQIISESPKRPARVDINVPSETEFETEVKARPSDFDKNGHNGDDVRVLIDFRNV